MHLGKGKRSFADVGPCDILGQRLESDYFLEVSARAVLSQNIKMIEILKTVGSMQQEGVIDLRQHKFLSIYVPPQSLLSDAFLIHLFERIDLGGPLFSDQIDLAKSPAAQLFDYVVIVDHFLVLEVSFEDRFPHESYVLRCYSKAAFAQLVSQLRAYSFYFAFAFGRV